MMYEIKPFGTGGIHVVLSKRAGFKDGDQVSIETPTDKNLLDPVLLALIFKGIEKKICTLIEDEVYKARGGQY